MTPVLSGQTELNGYFQNPKCDRSIQVPLYHIGCKKRSPILSTSVNQAVIYGKYGSVNFGYVFRSLRHFRPK